MSARGFGTFLRQLRGECHSYSNWLSSGLEGSGASGSTAIVARRERSGCFIFHWSAVNFLEASAMIYVIVPLPALWLVAWQCTAKCSCAVPSPESHLSSSSPSLLPRAFAGQPQGLPPAQHLPPEDHEGWVVITPAFNYPKINCLVQTGCRVSFSLLWEVQRHPAFPTPALGWTRGHRSPEGSEINPAPCFPPTPVRGIASLQLLPREAFSFLWSIQAGM